MSSRSDLVRDSLLGAGIRPSYPRMRVLDYLITKKSHPTADEIFGALVREMPTLSRTTVYNTLSLLEKANLAKVITIEENEMRYDANTLGHGHFKCLHCGKIYDFAVDIDALQPADLQQFKIKERDVQFRGVCPGCLASSANSD